MAQTLEHNKAVTTVVPVSIPTFDDDLAIIQKLDDEPNDIGGLTAMELKAKFDEGNVTAQQYINNVLLPAVVADDLTEQTRAAAEAERVANEIERVGNEEARVSAEEERERAIAKVENMTATATTLPAGSPATAEIVPDPATGAYNVKLGIPGGYDGYGSGDMLASTYDPTYKRQDIFKYANTKISEHNSSTSAHADIRAALNGKAPAGYGGFGEVIPSGRSFNSDESFIEWITGEISSIPAGASKQVRFALSYQFDPNTWADYFSGAEWYGTLTNESGYGTLVVSSYGGFNSKGTYQMVRNFYNNVWSPWEAVNPPMVNGVEYRTAERYNGKPVYKKRVFFSALVSSGYASAEIAAGVDAVIDLKAKVISSDGYVQFNTVVSDSGEVLAKSQCQILSGNLIVQIASIADVSNRTADIVVAYTKIAD